MKQEKPFAQSSENNKTPILQVLIRCFQNASHVLEIGSGTGQHAIYFAANLPHLTWQSSELPEHQSGISAWINDEGPPNVKHPIELDVTSDSWPEQTVDAVYSANTAHIMPLSAVESMFRGVGIILNDGGVFALYGPFNYNGAYTSEGNRTFDEILIARECGSGIRDFEKMNEFAMTNGLILIEDNAMPANNHLLVWQKQA